MPAVSVILPTRDRAHLLPRAAASVLRQEMADLEILVVDDAGTRPVDPSMPPLDDRRVRVLRTGDRPVGPARARNVGIAAALGEWIAFQDDDDEWLAGKLTAQLRAAAADPASGVVYSPFLRVAADGTRTPGPAPRGGGDLHEALLLGNFIGLPSALVRRSALAEVGPFDESLACFEDWELFLRLAARTRFALVDRPLALAYDSPGSVNKAPHAVQAAAYARILERHRLTIVERPRTHAAFLFHIGHHLVLAGDGGGGRRHLADAVRRQPAPRYLAAWTAARLGPRGYRVLCRAAGRA